MKFKKILAIGLIMITFIVSGCSVEVSQNETATYTGLHLTVTPEAKVVEKVSVQPKLGDSLSIYKEYYGKPDSSYMDAYGFDDTVNIDTENGLIREVSLKYQDDTFLSADEATVEINKFLPIDAKKIAELFRDNPYEQEAEVKGRIFVRVIEGDPSSEVRREDETIVRMQVGISKTDEVDLSLNNK